MTRRSAWLASDPAPAGATKLVCLPHAGGGGAAMRGWTRVLPEMEVIRVQLPGRESRLREPPMVDLLATADTIAAELHGVIDDDYVVFGHSMGGLLGFELVRALARRGRTEPNALVVAASPAPTRRRGPQVVHLLSDAALAARVARISGTPASVLEHDELLRMMLPTIRADFQMCETYTFRRTPLLTCPIVVLAGVDDAEVRHSELADWADMTTGPVTFRMFAGGHFFPQDQPVEVAEAIRSSAGSEPRAEMAR